MKGKRFKEEQIFRILHEAEGGLTVAEVYRKHNCSEQSFYRWKSKFGGLAQSTICGQQRWNSHQQFHGSNKY